MTQGIRRSLFAFMALAAGCLPAQAVPSAQQESPKPESLTLAVGVQDSLSPDFYADAFGPMMLRLRTLFPSVRFEAKRLSADGLAEALKENSLDLLFADSGVFAYAQRAFGVVQIAARQVPGVSDPREATAMAVAVRSASRFKSLSDVVGKRLASDSPESAVTWLGFLSLLEERGLKTKGLEEQASFSQYAIPGALAEVEMGEADAAVVPACQLEQYEVAGIVGKGTLRVLEPAEGWRCQRTGPYFPDVIFGATGRVNPDLLRLLTISALSIEAAPGQDAWSIVNDFSNVDSVYRNLRIGPYAYLNETNWRGLLEKYGWLLWLAALGLAGWAFHTFRVQVLVRRRTEQLAQAQAAWRQDRERLYLMERSGIVSGLCSMLVHEVRQPLSTLIAYGGGLKMYLEKGKADSVVKDAAQGMIREARRVNDIVEHVRRYAKETDHPHEAVEVRELLARIRQSFEASSASAGSELTVSAPERRLEVMAEPLEWELAVVNLLKNAAAAGRENLGPEQCAPVLLEVLEEPDSVVFAVKDAGRKLSTEELAAMNGIRASGRPDGLGLGLFIVRQIAERHGGSLRFKGQESGGLSAELRIPRMKEEKK